MEYLECPNCKAKYDVNPQIGDVHLVGGTCALCRAKVVEKTVSVQTEYSHEERVALLDRMDQASNIFYTLARHIGVHTFLEINGLIVKLIGLYRRMHEKGVDFGTNDTEAEPHDMEYVAEKIGCIFGEALRDPANRAAFLTGLGIKLPNEEDPTLAEVVACVRDEAKGMRAVANSPLGGSGDDSQAHVLEELVKKIDVLLKVRG